MIWRRACEVTRVVCFASLAFVISGTGGRAETPDASAGRFVHEGVAVECAILPAASSSLPSPLEGKAARIRFTITDTTTGKPLTQLHPAAWLSRRDSGGAQPKTCAEKIREFLGGSIFAKADLDLNTFRVIALNDDATLTVVDPLFGFGGTKLLALVPLASPGADWVLSNDGNRLLVTQPAAGKLSMVDTASWKIIANLALAGSPSRTVLQPDGHYLWVSCDVGVTAVVVDASVAVPAVAATITTGRGPHEIVVSDDNRWAFVTNEAEQTLSVIDIRSLKKTKDIPLEDRPVSMACSHLSDAIYITGATRGTILAVDAQKHEIVARITAEPGLGQIKFAPGGRFGFVANPSHNLVHILDASTNRIVQSAPIDGAPEQFTFSGDMAFVRRRGNPVIEMMPLKEIGNEGQLPALAEFPGGEAAFGERTALADGMMAAPGETAVVVANPVDKAIYYYMEGMAAPMGNFGNYGRAPRAVLVVDRSLHEVAPGVYETAADLPPAGVYDTLFYLDSPKLAHCFETQIPADPAREAERLSARMRLELVSPAKLVAGMPAHVVFRLKPVTGAAVAAPADLTVLTMLAPGAWHIRKPAAAASDGAATFDFTPPEAGMYYFYAESPSLGLALNRTPVFILEADAPPTP